MKYLESIINFKITWKVVVLVSIIIVIVSVGAAALNYYFPLH